MTRVKKNWVQEVMTSLTGAQVLPPLVPTSSRRQEWFSAPASRDVHNEKTRDKIKLFCAWATAHSATCCSGSGVLYKGAALVPSTVTGCNSLFVFPLLPQLQTVSNLLEMDPYLL